MKVKRLLIAKRAIAKVKFRTWISLGLIGVLLPIAVFRAIFSVIGAPPVANTRWNFDEAQGTTAQDYSSNDNDGTITGATWVEKDRCVDGNCLFYDGTGDFVSRADDADMDFAAADSFTFSFWFRHAPKTSGTEVIIAKHNATAGGYKIVMESDGDITCGQDDDSTYGPEDSVTSTAATYDDNKWHHVACVKNGSTSLTLYVDGNSVGTPDTSFQATGTLANADIFYLGIDGNGSSNPFTGYIDEMRVYRQALSAAEILVDFNFGAAASFKEQSSDFLTEGLAGYWKADETSGNMADSSGNGTTLTDTNTVAFVGGKFGKAGDFELANSEYQSAADNTSLSITGSLTLAAWIRPETVSAGSYNIIAKWDGSNESYRLFQNGDEVRLELDSAGNYVETTVSNLVVSTYYHIVGTYHAGTATAKIFINGVLATTTTTGTIPSSIGDDAGKIHLGAEDSTGGATGYYDGHIDDARIYNRTFSPSEVSALYAWAPGPVGHWKLDENTGTSAKDVSGYANNGTLLGSTVPSWVNGKFGSGLSFNGSTSYVDAGTGSNLQITSNLTLSGWVNLQSTAAANEIVTKYGPSGQYSYRLFVDTNGKLNLQVSSNGLATTTVTGATTLSTNTWYYVTGVYVPSTSLTVFVNGAQDAQNTTSIPASINNATAVELNIGTKNNALAGGVTFVQECQDNGNINVTSLTITCSTTAGNLLALTFATNTGASRTYAISDTGGNTWTLCASCEHRPSGITNSGEMYYTLATASNTTITITITGGSTNIAGSVQEFSGIQASPLDKSNNGFDDTGSTSMTSNASGTTVQAHEVAVGHLAVINSGTITGSASGWTYNTTEYSGSVLGIASGYKILTATGTETNTGTAGTSGRWTASVATFKAETPGVSVASGSIDDVRVYNYDRTASQIVEDMNAGHPTGGSPIGSQAIYWKFDEGQGVATTYNTVDVNTDGTLSGFASPATSTSGWTRDGKINKALVFDGSNDNVNIPTASDSLVDFNAAEKFSVGAWIYVTTSPGASDEDIIIGKWDETGAAELRAYRLYITDADTDNAINLVAELYDESANQTLSAATTTEPLSLNTWYRVVMTHNGGIAGAAGDLKTYINGKSAATNSANASFLGVDDVASDFTIGDYDATDAFSGNTAFTGRIDEVQVYSDELTADQIKIIANAGSNAAFSTLSGPTTEETDVVGSVGNAPVAWWTFDDNTGTSAVDSSGNANTGTWTGSATHWSAGKVGSAGVFAGATDYVTVGDATSLDLTTAMTMEAWVKPSSLPNTLNQIFIKNDANTNFYGLNIRDTGAIQAQISGVTPNTATSNSGLVITNTWTHVAVSYDGSNYKIYKNGILETTTSASGSTTASTASLGIGRDAVNSGRDFNGSIDNVLIYNYVRNAAQIAYDFNRGRPMSHWKMDDCTGTTVNDLSLNAEIGNSVDGGWSGPSGSNTSAGTCAAVDTATAWYNGRNGKYGSSLDFDGTDDTVNVGDVNTLDFERTEPFSISAWIKTSTDAGMTIVSKQESSGNFRGYNVQTGAGGLIFFQAVNVYSSNTLEVKTLSDTNYDDGNWHHIVITYDGSSSAAGALIYMDGTLRAKDPSPVNNLSATIDTTASFHIGSRNGAAQFFDGQIDDVQVFNYKLTAEQVRKIMNEGSAARFGPATGTP